MGTRNDYTSVLSTGRPGWRQGHGESAASWFYGAGDVTGAITFSRGMFCGELPRPGERGVINVGERPTLLAAQMAVEHQAARFAGRSIDTVSTAPTRSSSSTTRSSSSTTRSSSPATRSALPGERFSRRGPSAPAPSAASPSAASPVSLAPATRVALPGERFAPRPMAQAAA